MAENERRQAEIECPIAQQKVILSIAKHRDCSGENYEKVVDILCPYKTNSNLILYCSKRPRENRIILISPRYEECGYYGTKI